MGLVYKKEVVISRKINHKIRENPPLLFGRQPDARLRMLSRSHRSKDLLLNINCGYLANTCTLPKLKISG